MKQIIKNYTFSASAKTVTLTDFTTVRLDRLQLIVDVTINKVLYNFADATLSGATVAGNVVTLTTVTGGASSSDGLQIVYDAAAGDPTYDLPVLAAGAAIDQTASDIGWQMERLLNLLRPLSIVTGAGSNRLSIDVSTVAVVTSVTGVTTVATLTNQANIGNVNAFTQQQAILRGAYATGISANLTFS